MTWPYKGNLVPFLELKVLKRFNPDFPAGQWNQKKSMLLPAEQGRRGKNPVLKTRNTNSSPLIDQKWKTQNKGKLGRHGRSSRAERQPSEKSMIGLPHPNIGLIGVAQKPKGRKRGKGRVGQNRDRIENGEMRNGRAGGVQGNEIWLAKSGGRGAKERGGTEKRGKNEGQEKMANSKKERRRAHNKVGRVDEKKGSTNRQRGGKRRNRFWKGKLAAGSVRKGKVKALSFREGKKVKARKERKHKGVGQPRMQGKGQSNKGKRRQEKRMQGNNRFGSRRQRSNWKRPGNRLKGVRGKNVERKQYAGKKKQGKKWQRKKRQNRMGGKNRQGSKGRRNAPDSKQKRKKGNRNGQHRRKKGKGKHRGGRMVII